MPRRRRRSVFEKARRVAIIKSRISNALIGPKLKRTAQAREDIWLAPNWPPTLRGGWRDHVHLIGLLLAHCVCRRLMRTGTCFITTDFHFEDYDYDTCLRQDSGKKNYLLLGDSHSAMFWYALSSSLHEANIMQASTAACQPSLHPLGSADCRKMMKYICPHIRFRDCLLQEGGERLTWRDSRNLLLEPLDIRCL